MWQYCCLVNVYFSFFLFLAVSFTLWFVSAGLLTVLWALAIGLLGMLLFKNSFIFTLSLSLSYIINQLIACSLLSLPQPPYYTQASEHQTWKLAWTHFVRNSVQFGATTVSCSLHRVSQGKYKPVVIWICFRVIHVFILLLCLLFDLSISCKLLIPK